MTEQLYIENIYIPLSKSLNASITKSIADIEKPDQRKATYSKSARIPNSKPAQEVFGSLFMINIVNSSFDPSVKAAIRYVVDGEEIMNGYCQLKKIIQTDNKEIEYEIVMYGTNANLFSSMGEKELIDLASWATDPTYHLDRWDHPFSKSVQSDSWATQVWDADAGAFIPFALGTGYVYPLMDYGFTTNLDNFYLHQMPCALYAKEYVDAIFFSNGFSYTSTFFDSTYFKSLIIPSSPSSYQLTSAEITANQFAGNTPNFTSTGTTTSNNIPLGTSYSAVDTLIFTNDVSDPSGLLNNATGEYTIVAQANAGVFDLNALIDINATFTPSTGAAVVTTCDINGFLRMYKNGNLIMSKPFYITYDDYPSTFTTGARSTATAPTYPDNSYLSNASVRFSQSPNASAAVLVPRTGEDVPDRYLLTANNVTLDNGDVVTVRWQARVRGVSNDDGEMFLDAGAGKYTGNAVLNVSVGAFYNKVVNQFPVENSTLKIEKIIPKDIKQRDFFMGLVKMFNLWIDIDPNDPTNLLVEPRDDFLSEDKINLQPKLDQSKPLEIIPMGKLDAAEYYFSYTPDKDFLNDKYTADWTRVYGDRKLLNTGNDFVKNTKTIKPLFSPTPLAAPPNSTRVLSTIIAEDSNGEPIDTDHNIRILYYGGLKSGKAWNHISGFGGTANPTVNVTYPFAGHVDDPHTWTEDINFGLIKEVYYDDNQTVITITDNNLVNKYYSAMLQEYTATESKIARGFFNVTPTDFREWTFDKLYWFENAYWRLNKIQNYNPTGETLTRCEFLFLTDVPSFLPTGTPINGDDDKLPPIGTGGGTVIFTEDSPAKGTKTAYNPDGNNTSGKGVEIMGLDNIVAPDSFYVQINGDGNKVYQEAENIKISGDNNVIEGGTKNVVLINTSGLTIDESDVTYIDGKQVNSWPTKTTTFTVDGKDVGYWCDTDSAAYTATANVRTDIGDWIFKNIGTSGNDLTIDCNPFNIDDIGTSVTLSDQESIRIKWNEDEQVFNIIN